MQIVESLGEALVKSEAVKRTGLSAENIGRVIEALVEARW